MPGKNSGWDPKRDSCLIRWFPSKIWFYIIIFVIIIESWGVIRFALIWENRRYSYDSFLWIGFFIFTDFFIFKSMLITKNIDPGYIIPEKLEKEKQKDD